MAKTLEQFTTECTNELQAKRDSSDGIFKQVNNERLAINDSDFAQMVIDCANYKLDVQDNGYKTARQISYASVQDQLDMQYWDSVNSTTTWADHIAKVKSDNPKPE
tara:strand:+ start:495 stop:812 length:318 start_codon:yes stop_codon:yes gene_type:complete